MRNKMVIFKKKTGQTNESSFHETAHAGRKIQIFNL